MTSDLLDAYAACKALCGALLVAWVFVFLYFDGRSS